MFLPFVVEGWEGGTNAAEADLLTRVPQFMGRREG